MPTSLDLFDAGRILVMRYSGSVHHTDAARLFERGLEVVRKGDVCGLMIDSSQADVKESPAWMRSAAEDFFIAFGKAYPVVYIGPAEGWPVERAAMLKCVALEFDIDFEIKRTQNDGLNWLRGRIARNAVRAAVTEDVKPLEGGTAA